MIEHNVHTIYPLNNNKDFSKNESLEMVNLFLAITTKAKNKINGLNSRLEYFKGQQEIADQIQLELNIEIQKWSDKMQRLGGVPLELYKAKIPADGGYFMWEFPHASVEYYPDLQN